MELKEENQMLKLTDIRKSYKTFDFTQTALDGVSVAFRNNEFAAILGSSGSGKTTMLNIIGGLDHYDSGDLEIDGISTKKYKSGDWDTYRNNRIGFVFQSYNLIPHQSILANVELALTLSGVSPAERKERAAKALSDVGLGEHVRKLPNQLSGGQMQRVAIARALINDPEILLADEPTGALDTKTSKQVMELLREIAEKRLVIMVTHNPELADEYANRIIRLQDGQIVDDTNPLDPKKEKQHPGSAPRKVNMSLFTAVSLSLSNLLTKKGRTFVVSLAGSIGIIGIAAILALASGINAYIENIEEETMSIYPLTIQQSGIDLSSLFASMGAGGTDTEEDTIPEEQKKENQKVEILEERKIIESLFQSQNKNDLESLKFHIEENETDITPYVKTIQYIYDVTPQIYLSDTSEGIDQVSPDALFSRYGIGGSSAMTSLFGGSSGGMNVFHELPGDSEMYDYQYQFKAGRWPQGHDEAVLVLMSDGSISDYVLYTMGLRERRELKDMLSALLRNPDEEVKLENEEIELTYGELMEAEFKVVSAAKRYEYDEHYSVWVDRSDNTAWMEKIIAEGTDLKIVGVVWPDPDAAVTTLSPGIHYTPELVSHLMEEAGETDIVKQQLEKSEVNVLTAKTFAEEKEEGSQSDFALADLLSIDEEKIKKAFVVDESKINLDFSDMGDLSGMDLSGMDLSGMDLTGMDLSGLDLSGMDLSGMDLSGLDLSGMDDLSVEMGDMQMPEMDLSGLTASLSGLVHVSEDVLRGIIVQVLQGFLADQAAQGVQDPGQMAGNLQQYLSKPAVQEQISGQIGMLVDFSQLESKVSEAVGQYLQTVMETYMKQIMTSMQGQIQKQMESQMTKLQTQLAGQLRTQIQSALETQIGQFMRQLQSQMEGQFTKLGTQIQSQMEAAMQQLPEQLQQAIQIDQNDFAAAFRMNMSENEIMELMTAMMNQEDSTYENNLRTLGYATTENPLQINLYPINFNSKSKVEEFLTDYNEQMEDLGEEEKVINYTDLVGTMMSSVTDIVDTISYALIAFVGISLVVSSIMIGVITYISVLERKKEIGILRAIGASKRDVRRVFNAETLIIGFIAGMLGVAVTYLISLIANIIVYEKLGIENIAQLPVTAAMILIGISMLLAFISGLFPASAAARKDPVEALRSE